MSSEQEEIVFLPFHPSLGKQDSNTRYEMQVTFYLSKPREITTGFFKYILNVQQHFKMVKTPQCFIGAGELLRITLKIIA